MPKRVAIAGFSHETNTFSPIVTRYESFVAGGLWRDTEVEARLASSHSVVAGFLRATEEQGLEGVPLFFARAEPLGIIARNAADQLIDELIERLAANGPWHGVLLALHGAAVAEHEHDLDGLIVTRVRATVGPSVPVGVVYDLHANVSQRMIDQVDVAVFYRTNPHLDTLERGLECGRLIGRTMAEEIRPTQALVRLPLIIGITRSDTSEQPMKGLLAQLEELLRTPGMLSASIAEGFPWADVPEMGMAFLAVADVDATLARESAAALARSAWERRTEMIDQPLTPEQAMISAATCAHPPVGVLDVGDNIGGGGGGDSTVLLEIALKRQLSGVLLTIYDPEAVRTCEQAGEGAFVRVSIGGKLDAVSCRSLDVSGRVRRIVEGKFEETSATHEGYRFFDAGRTAVLELERDVTVVLTSLRVGNVSQMQFLSLGIDPRTKRIVILKGVNAPRGAFRSVCSRFVLADTAGATSANLRQLPYRYRTARMFPLESQIEPSFEAFETAVVR